MKQNKTLPEITKDMLIADLMEYYPKAAETLVEKYDFHCIGCTAASMETIEEGAQVHGRDDKEIEVMIEDLKKVVILK